VILSTASRQWGVDERSGVVRWEREADVLVATAVGDGLALETSTDEVIAFDVLTGEVRWQADVDEVVYAQPEAGVVVAATPVGSVVLDVATGEELWSLGEQVVAILGGDDLMVSVQVR
jgi:outer membrane protein assembly factor BamB